MTTDKQTDYYQQYDNVEVISGNETLGHIRIVAQTKHGKWILFEATEHWGGNISKGKRMRDLSGNLVSFKTKDEAIAFSNSVR